jgi:hypothetical protein
VTTPIIAPAGAPLPEEATAVPPPGATAREILTALVAAMIAGASVELIARILARFPELTRALVERILTGRSWGGLLGATAEERTLIPRTGTPPALVLEQLAAQNAFRRAAYLDNALRRLAPAVASGDVDRIVRAERAEDRYFAAFLEAERRRGVAASAVALIASQYGINDRGEVLLGWQAVLDNRTSADCRWAHRRNFNALVVPRIGYPGTVHLDCRCRPRRPWNTDLRVEDGTPPVHH